MFENHVKVQIFINKDLGYVIKAKQFDAASRFLDVQLFHDDGIPVDLTDCRVEFNAKKSDDTYIKNNAEITDRENGEFTIELTDQTLAVGNSIIQCEITVYSNDAEKLLTTRDFFIEVQAVIRNDAAVESSNEYNAVVVLFQDVWDMRTVITQMNERFGELTDDLTEGDEQAGSSALGSINRMWNYLKTQSTAGIVETVSNIIDFLGQANPTSSNRETVMNYLRFLETKGAVKRVQRGYVKMSSKNISVSISTIDVNKASVLLNGTGGAWSDYQTAISYTPYVSALTSTSLSIGTEYVSPKSEGYTYVSWQVIEFY